MNTCSLFIRRVSFILVSSSFYLYVSSENTTYPECYLLSERLIPIARMDHTTFHVDKVERATKRLQRSTVDEAVKKRILVQCEAVFYTSREIVDVAHFELDNRFIATVHIAYSEHYPLVLTPDVIWMCIAQGFATHVNCNSEKLRHFFVQHEGKKELNVRRDDFVNGSPSNPWPEVFDDFSAQIKTAVGDKVYGALTPSFSTTGPVERAAAQLAVMDAFKKYFSYKVCSRCGIPEITLEGTVGDWIALKEKTMALKDFDLSWWTDELSPILDQFVEAASGRVDQTFWSSIYKFSNHSGGPFITGWITTLYPYIGESSERNTFISSWRKRKRDDALRRPFNGITSDSFPPGLCSTPFTWNYLGTECQKTFYSGFMAVSQDPNTLALRPEIGWGVAEQADVDRKIEQTKQRLRYWHRNQ